MNRRNKIKSQNENATALHISSSVIEDMEHVASIWSHTKLDCWSFVVVNNHFTVMYSHSLCEHSCENRQTFEEQTQLGVN